MIPGNAFIEPPTNSDYNVYLLPTPEIGYYGESGQPEPISESLGSLPTTSESLGGGQVNGYLSPRYIPNWPLSSAELQRAQVYSPIIVSGVDGDPIRGPWPEGSEPE